MVKFLTALMTLSFILGAAAHAKPELKSKIRSNQVLLTNAQFKKLSAKKRARYISRIKDIFVEHEKMMMKYIPVVENKISVPLFFETAVAGWAGETCVIGGQKAVVVGSGACSTRGFKCEAEGITDGFKCGGIFSNVCIQRVVDGSVGTISSRCRAASKDDPKVDVKVLGEARTLYNEICSGEDSTKVSCQILTAKLDKETKRADEPVATPEPPAPGEPTTGTPGTPTPAAPAAPVPPLDGPEAAPTTSTRCYEKPSAERCAEGSLTLAKMEDGTIDIAGCRRSDENKPFRYARQGNTFAFLKFLKENKTNPIVIKGLSAFGIKADDSIENGKKQDGAITFLERFHRDEGRTHDPYFDLGGIAEGGSPAAAEEMLVLFNTKNELCDDILKVRNELAQDSSRNSARKKLSFEETKTDADYNLAHVKDFEEYCKAEPPKVPPVRALEIKMANDAVWNVFPTQITADGDGKWKFQMLDGTRTTEGLLTKNRDGSFTFFNYADETEYSIKEFSRVHRQVVNVQRPADATGDSACDSFRGKPAAAAVVPAATGDK
jgi:hypothetical protein